MSVCIHVFEHLVHQSVLHAAAFALDSRVAGQGVHANAVTYSTAGISDHRRYGIGFAGVASPVVLTVPGSVADVTEFMLATK